MTRALSGRVAVVTGVTAGTGRILARRLPDAGASVLGCARDEQRLEAVAAELPGLVTRCGGRSSGSDGSTSSSTTPGSAISGRWST
jgi:NAD(P)-dependent dehydrogenase (short-subunit alcohol dehydrogenase family)